MQTPEQLNVCIGIQARSTSERLPNKAFEKIGDKTMLEHVVDACRDSALYVNRGSHRTGIRVDVAIVTPTGDPIVEEFKRRIRVIEGDEQNVLSRYATLAQVMRADWIVRVTGDCPLIPHFLITKHINTAIMNRYDYVANVDPAVRTAVDGYDCEAFSRRMLDHVSAQATDPYDLEHVTPMMRREPPNWATRGCIVGYLPMMGWSPQSGWKISVDTHEDLARVREMHEMMEQTLRAAIALYGHKNVHRL